MTPLKWKKTAHLTLITLLLVTASACVRAGRDFATELVPQIQIGRTTRDDVRRMFGPPWRTGIENGETTWTYGRYHKKMFGQSDATDLVVYFDNSGVVTSYSYSTTDVEK